ncbi:MAG: hypothetical protein QNJ41_14045 [Xenococcaceae cyanobacterium MO_188.B32]|nr:hypothetical protein [Xenococcaceae cyanobacterium MO_188.B32]
MRNRNRRKINRPTQNLDSFLDILTNTVGVLMFISLFVTLIASEADSIVKTPLSSETKKIPRFFEIRDNKIAYINDEKVGKDIEEITGNLPACNRPETPTEPNLFENQDFVSNLRAYRSCLRSRAQRIANFQTQTEYYNVRMINPSTFSFIYEPIPHKEGESKEELVLPRSEYLQVLEKLDPKKDYLAFIVRPDSFSGFRVAREEAWAKGFDVGWEPHKSERPIIFGSGGRAIGVQ